MTDQRWLLLGLFEVDYDFASARVSCLILSRFAAFLMVALRIPEFLSLIRFIHLLIIQEDNNFSAYRE